ncbi:MAG: fructose-bisphosphate aldolase [Candidatus Peribacteraceae bacterium]|nr:fructose-bisphosphate aldolase [Candidatus Peribacteraceae bacterium]
MATLSHAKTLERLGQDKDLIAMDQSKGTHVKHMQDQFGINVDPAAFDSVASRVRQMIRTTPNHGHSFAGRIEYIDEIMTPDRRPIESGLDNSESVVICKLLGLDKETGLIPQKDMDAFPDQIRALSNIGVHVVKLRSTFYPGMPQADIARGIEQFVELQKALTKQGDVSAVHEPEFLHTAKGNTHSLETNRTLMTMVLGVIALRFRQQDISHHPWLLKTSVAAPGKASGQPIDPEACGYATMRAFDEAGLPDDLNIYLLSGGHEDSSIRRIFQVIRGQRSDVKTSFSRTLLKQVYQEALNPNGTGREVVTVDSPVHVGRGQTELHRQGKLNRLARAGKYEPKYEDRQRYPSSDLPQ